MLKPNPGPEYLDWLGATWQGDTRELREGRYLHQQGDLRQAFERSDFWREVSMRLGAWADSYNQETEALLFQGAPARPTLYNKPWESFVSRTWRQNVRNNPNWPEPPPEGWRFPDNWFERARDIVRTRFVVRYLDGVRELAEDLLGCATERRFGLEADLEEQAKESGYYAFHVCIRQDFSVAALDYQSTQERNSRIEIQVTTELAEVISQLTHAYYEVRRESSPDARSWQWDYVSDEFTSNFLGHELHALEARVMALRQRLRESSAKPRSPRKSGRRVPGRSAKRGRAE